MSEIRIEEKSTEKLEELESARKKKNYNKAKNMLYEILDGKTYFSYKDKRYYLKNLTRAEGDRCLAFRNQMFYHYCAMGFLPKSEIDQLIKENPDRFPPVVYKITTRKTDTGNTEDIRNLTYEESQVVKDCLRQGIVNRETIEEELREKEGWSPRTELVMQPGETAMTLLNDCAENRSDAAYMEWSLVSRVHSAEDDKRVYEDWDEYYNSEEGLEFSLF